MQEINFSDEKKTTVLLIHDDMVVVKQLGRFLQSNGLLVLFAPAVLPAQKIISAKSPELILLSNNIPGIAAFYNYYREQYLSIPVLLLGAIPHTRLPAQLGMILNTSIVQQPVNEAELLLRIKELLELSALRRNQAMIDGVIDADLVLIHDALILYRSNKNIQEPELSGIIASLEHVLSDLNIYRATAQTRPLLTAVSDAPLILLVEDNVLNQEYVSSLLYEAGYRIVLASNGAEAVKHLETIRPGLVILDMVLPDCSGREVYIELRRRQPGVPVIILSGHSKSDLLEEHSLVEFEDYLQKPVEANMLLERVAARIRSGPSTTQLHAPPSLPLMHSSEQLAAWLPEFKTLIEELRQNIRLLLSGQSAQINRKVLHAVLNYSVYYGNDAFRLILRSLAENEHNSEILELCLSEIAALSTN
jgi:DNA-binding response OmpR family regulator